MPNSTRKDGCKPENFANILILNFLIWWLILPWFEADGIRYRKKNPKAWVISSLIDEISWGKSEGLANKNIINDNYNLIIDRWSKGDFDSKIEEGKQLGN